MCTDTGKTIHIQMNKVAIAFNGHTTPAVAVKTGSQPRVASSRPATAQTRCSSRSDVFQSYRGYPAMELLFVVHNLLP